MPRFRLRSDHGSVDLFQPSAGADSFHVEPGETVEIPGELVTSQRNPDSSPVPDDAYLVVRDDVEAAWPRETWELVNGSPAAPAAPVEEN